MDILAELRMLDRDGHPLPPEGPPVRWPPQGLEMEARATRRREPLALRRLQVRLRGVFAWAVLGSGVRLGRFDPARYQRETASNTDFRKFDDGLRMTIDCSTDIADRVEARLAELRATGVLAYGTFRQKQALVTCIVPDVTHDDHMHFVDGADGGYAIAARMLKETARA
jgi:hypothetical protein